MLILCLGSFLTIALHFLTVFNFTCNYGACFIKMVPFFSIRAHQRSKLSFSCKLAQRPTVYHYFSFLELGNYFLSVKQI